MFLGHPVEETPANTVAKVAAIAVHSATIIMDFIHMNDHEVANTQKSRSWVSCKNCFCF